MSYEIHTIASIFPAMSDAEFSALKADIAQHGQREPIWMYEGKVIDGRHRARACDELGITPRVETYTGDDAVAFVVSLNLHRRHLSASQLAFVALEIERAESVMAKNRMIAGGGDKKSGVQQIAHPIEDAGRARDKAADAVGVNRQYVTDAKRIEREAPELAEKIKAGQITIPQARREIRAIDRQARVNEAKAQAATSPPDSRFTLILSPVAALPADTGSIDVIITDPPYPREYLSVYGELAQTAARILKPGGSCIVMVGHSYLPEIIVAMSAHLRYHWICAYLTPGGQAAQMWDRKVNTFWKPLLWFTNGAPALSGWTGDVTRSAPNDNDKEHHHWGQSLSGMLDVVRRFSAPGDMVCDPFCGAGTTGVACMVEARRFLGADSDADALAVAKARCLEHAA